MAEKEQMPKKNKKPENVFWSVPLKPKEIQIKQCKSEQELI